MPILEWLNKEEAVKTADKVPYRVLKANKELSYGEQSENMIIKGDNLEALKHCYHTTKDKLSVST